MRVPCSDWCLLARGQQRRPRPQRPIAGVERCAMALGARHVFHERGACRASGGTHHGPTKIGVHRQHLHRLGGRAQCDVPNLGRGTRGSDRIHQTVCRRARRAQRAHEQRAAGLDRQLASTRAASPKCAHAALWHKRRSGGHHCVFGVRGGGLHHGPKPSHRRRPDAFALNVA